MERDERNIYIKGITLCAVFIILAVYLYTLPVRAKKGAFEASNASDEDFIEEEAETAKTWQIRERTASGMPCDNPEQFERWLEAYEQEASEESETVLEEKTVESAGYSVPVGVEVETEVKTETAGVSQKAKCYSINGELIDPVIQQKLYNYLKAEGIEDWFTGALVQMYQESRGQQFAENPNGLDKGLYQYRITYWTEPESIFDVDAQLRRYARETAQRINAGLSVDEIISRHNTSDYIAEVNWEYVAQVKQHLSNLREVK